VLCYSKVECHREIIFGENYNCQAINFFNCINLAINFFKLRINRSFNTHFVCYTFQFVFRLRVDVSTDD